MNDVKEKFNPTMVVKIIDDYKLIINKGRNQGVKDGQRYLIYEIGEEIIDPNTNKSLGKLEIIKGTGKVVHTQNNMATISSDMKTQPLRSITKKRRGSLYDPLQSLGKFFEPDETIELLPAEKVAFDYPKVGDIARQI